MKKPATNPPPKERVVYCDLDGKPCQPYDQRMVALEGYEDFRFFATQLQKRSSWAITEAISGHDVSGHYRTKMMALSAMERTLSKKTPDELRRRIKEVVEANGCMPGWQDAYEELVARAGA